MARAAQRSAGHRTFGTLLTIADRVHRPAPRRRRVRGELTRFGQLTGLGSLCAGVSVPNSLRSSASFSGRVNTLT